jgi:hypothetical protein
MDKMEMLRALREQTAAIQERRPIRRALETKAVPKADPVLDVHPGQVARELVRPASSPKPQAAADEISARPKTGRPRIEDRGKTYEATMPWSKMGMSRRTWYRRKSIAKPLAPKVS